MKANTVKEEQFIADAIPLLHAFQTLIAQYGIKGITGMGADAHGWGFISNTTQDFRYEEGRA